MRRHGETTCAGRPPMVFSCTRQRAGSLTTGTASGRCDGWVKGRSDGVVQETERCGAGSSQAVEGGRGDVAQVQPLPRDRLSEGSGAKKQSVPKVGLQFSNSGDGRNYVLRGPRHLQGMGRRAGSDGSPEF